MDATCLPAVSRRLAVAAVAGPTVRKTINVRLLVNPGLWGQLPGVDERGF